MSRILIAGASGFLGRYLCQLGLERGHEILALTGQPQGASEDARVVHVPVRLEQPDALDDDRVIELCSGVEVIINAAGPGDPELPRGTLIHLHAFRTAQLLSLALRLPTMRQFVQISSTSIAGNYAGTFTESMRDVGQTFESGIGAAFLAAEQCVAGTEAPFSRTVARFGVLVGDSHTGYYPRLSGVYKILATAHRLKKWDFLLKKMRILVFPFSDLAKCYLMPVDLAATAALHLAGVSSDSPTLETYHVIGSCRGVSIRRLLDACLKDAGLEIELLAVGEVGIAKSLFHRFGLSSSLIEGLTTQAHWSNDHFASIMPDFVVPPLSELGPVLLDYAHGHLLSWGSP